MNIFFRADVASPYPGLRPFNQEESVIFFGRDQQIDDILARLKLHRFLGIVGTSGCGKSSLIRAGVLPALQSGLMGELGTDWFIADMKPGNSPIANLARALIRSGITGTRWSNTADSVALLSAQLRRSDRSLVNLVHSLALPPNVNLLVLADQFEEIFRFHQDDPNEALAFVNLLLASIREASSQIFVVLTMRTDFLGECARFADLPEALNDSLYLCPGLTRTQLAEAIERPAEVFGGKVEAALVREIISDARSNSDQLPLIQHVLARIWHADNQPEHALANGPILRLADYRRVGGLSGDPGMDDRTTRSTLMFGRGMIEHTALNSLASVHPVQSQRLAKQNALSQHADEAFFELAEAPLTSTGTLADQQFSRKQQIAEMLFRSLATRSTSGQYVRRPIRVRDAAEIAGCTVAELIDVVEVFRREDRSFLVPPPSVPLNADTVLDISHEALIRQWQRFGGQLSSAGEAERTQSWLGLEEVSRARYRRLTEAAENEQTSGLLTNPELQFLDLWWRGFQPTHAWCNACVPDSYDRTFDFLNRSLVRSAELEREQSAIQSAKLAAAQQRAREAYRWSIALAILVIFVACSLVYAWQANAKLKSSNRELVARTEQVNRLSAITQLILRDPEKAKVSAMSYLGMPNVTEPGVEEKNANEKDGTLGEVLFLRKNWGSNPRKLTISFIDGDSDQHRLVEEVAQEWSKHTCIQFEFLPFQSAKAGNIRITFDGSGSWSFVGTDILHIPPDRPTMALAGLKTNEDELTRATILSHFGHTLGLIKEHQNPNANIPWDEEAVYLYYGRTLGWSRSQVEQSILRRYTGSYKAFDPKSVMMIAIPAELTKNGVEFGLNYELSEGDKAFVRKVYPPKSEVLVE